MPAANRTLASVDLAAVLIVRNEARCIARCLESVRPWVDRIVLLDTGSTDDTVAIARRLGAEVHHCDWPDDFAAARNHALDRADADWNFFIDADEWILSGGDLLRDWVLGPARLGKVCQNNMSDLAEGRVADAPLPTSRNWITRLLPRNVRYEGRVHEQVVSPLPRHRIDLHLGHDGYLEAHRTHKLDRNQPLLLLELQAHPGDPYILYQLGKEAEGREDHRVACDFYGQSAAATPGDANWAHELLVRRLHCLGRAGRLDEALSLAGDHMAAWEGSPDFFFVLGNLLLDRAMADPANALAEWLPLVCSAWESCLAIGERPELEGSVAGRGSHLARYNLNLVRSQIAALAA
jgi:glycosyltransferase involved in cell wall biosynthesis